MGWLMNGACHGTIDICGENASGFTLHMKTKSWMPKGVPSELLWTNACRNAKKLKFIKESLYTMLDMEKPNDASYRRIDIEEAIDMWRACLRCKKYLLSSTSEFCSVCGELLNLEITKEARLKRYHISQMFLPDESIPNDPALFHPVYVMSTERAHLNDIAFQKKDCIKGQILKQIEDIRGSEVKLYYLSKLKSKVPDKVSFLLSFYYEVEDYVKNEETIDRSMLDEET